MSLVRGSPYNPCAQAGANRVSQKVGSVARLEMFLGRKDDIVIGRLAKSEKLTIRNIGYRTNSDEEKRLPDSRVYSDNMRRKLSGNRVCERADNFASCRDMLEDTKLRLE